jgi:hypothetical protein
VSENCAGVKESAHATTASGLPNMPVVHFYLANFLTSLLEDEILTEEQLLSRIEKARMYTLKVSDRNREIAKKATVKLTSG